MTWEDVGNSIASIAPTIGGALANIAMPGTGPIAAAGIRAILIALGLSSDSGPDQVDEAIKADPEALIKLRNSEQQFVKDMKALDIDLERVYAADRDSARKMAIETRDKTPAIFGAIISLMFGGIVGSLMFFEVPAPNQNVFFSCIGILGTVFTAFATYLYGSNKDSKMMTQLLAAASPVDTVAADKSGWKISRG